MTVSIAGRGIGTLLLVAPALLFVLALFIYPFAYGVFLSLHPLKGGALSDYQQFFSDPYLRQTIGITLGIAIPATLVNVLASIPAAYVLRGSGRGKRWISTILVVPVTLGTVFVSEGFLRYLGPLGWLNRTLMLLPFVHDPIQLVHNYWGVVLSLILTGFPFAFLLMQSYFGAIDPSLEKAAAVLGASPASRFRHIIFPLLLPGLAITFCLSFVLAFAVFPSALLLGNPSGETHVISIAAYQAAFEQYDYPLASTIAIIMSIVQLAVIAIVLGLRSRLYRGPVTGGKG